MTSSIDFEKAEFETAKKKRQGKRPVEARVTNHFAPAVVDLRRYRIHAKGLPLLNREKAESIAFALQEVRRISGRKDIGVMDVITWLAAETFGTPRKVEEDVLNEVFRVAQANE